MGVLSDTHGLLRPQVLERLAGCARILHAGDVGDPAILRRLEAIAPVAAVRGNVDSGATGGLPERIDGDLDGLPYRMAHVREDALAGDLARFRLVVYGHSHQPELAWRGRCLLLNPGACGARRFHLPLTVAVLTIAGGRIVPELLSVE